MLSKEVCRKCDVRLQEEGESDVLKDSDPYGDCPYWYLGCPDRAQNEARLGWLRHLRHSIDSYQGYSEWSEADLNQYDPSANSDLEGVEMPWQYERLVSGCYYAGLKAHVKTRDGEMCITDGTCSVLIYIHPERGLLCANRSGKLLGSVPMTEDGVGITPLLLHSYLARVAGASVPAKLWRMMHDQYAAEYLGDDRGGIE